jgi:hypothetical protein
MMELRSDVRHMLENEGLYIAFDPDHPNAIVPILSQDGLLYSMRVDAPLEPAKFFDRTTLHGPFWNLEANRLPR